MTFSISGRKIGASFKPYIIAEVSANHNGDLAKALQTIDAAADAGASAVKIQTYTADTMTIDCDLPDFQIHGGLWDGYKLYDLYKWAETPYEWHKAMFDHANARGITLFSTPFDESAVELLESLGAPAYKVASFELTDIPLIRCIAATGKPMIMSTGMASLEEVTEAVEAARASGCTDLVLLHCISSYPAPMEQANIRQMATLEKEFGVTVGLSDHTLGTVASVAAVSLGACVIEKHFTLSREDKGPDSEFSIEPHELKQLVEDANNAWAALGNDAFTRQKAEEPNRRFRRSLYFVKDLPAGHIVSENDIRRIRPGFGLAPKYYDDVIGRTLSDSVSRGTPVQWEAFDE
ncbi:N-acetylneuraminate synthase [Thalassolituus maritimus]|jgi:N-acetylneuraminate synthase|uniref:N-acetylneuraminate synthase n=1 Tax=Thalassolituus maritimus TaxID=484498 RepID=A0A1N7LM21_9GAMM|nr:pseudaminic acid synthase [Thalassolituus maritimus]SIS74857.1 N-acetylneuraminate synthase [Thalassolituus maritimus]